MSKTTMIVNSMNSNIRRDAIEALRTYHSAWDALGTVKASNDAVAIDTAKHDFDKTEKGVFKTLYGAKNVKASADEKRHNTQFVALYDAYTAYINADFGKDAAGSLNMKHALRDFFANCLECGTASDGKALTAAIERIAKVLKANKGTKGSKVHFKAMSANTFKGYLTLVLSDLCTMGVING